MHVLFAFLMFFVMFSLRKLYKSDTINKNGKEFTQLEAVIV